MLCPLFSFCLFTRSEASLLTRKTKILLRWSCMWKCHSYIGKKTKTIYVFMINRLILNVEPITAEIRSGLSSPVHHRDTDRGKYPFTLTLTPMVNLELTVQINLWDKILGQTGFHANSIHKENHSVQNGDLLAVRQGQLPLLYCVATMEALLYNVSKMVWHSIVTIGYNFTNAVMKTAFKDWMVGGHIIPHWTNQRFCV